MEMTRPVWHAGELAWQERVGVAERMAEMGPRVIRDAMPEQHRSFFAQLPFILAGFEDDTGKVWASLLAGPPGFVSSPNPQRLHIKFDPSAADPVAAALRPGIGLGILGIELPTRRRNRANGRVEHIDESGIMLAVEQSFGNCPKYIEKRDYGSPHSPHAATFEAITSIEHEAGALIRDSGTFFIASIAGHAGLPDVSHRGGRHGFVSITADGTLLVPDYAGNNFFNTLGNLSLDPRAGLLFPDFASGDVLQLTGQATIIADPPDPPQMPGAERYWQFKTEQGHWLRNAMPTTFAAGEVSSFSP